MEITTAVIIVLSALAIVLTVIAVRMSRRSAGASTDGHSFDPAAFQALLGDNATDGNIQSVASRVSDLLKGPCGCEKILFLRKQRGLLELNYYHGIRRFQRSEFRVRYSDDLAALARAGFHPRPLEDFRSFVPNRMYQRLVDEGMCRCISVHWRDNLYGLYFVSDSPALESPVFSAMCAAMVHSLSAAYHIKWHETRYDRMAHKLETVREEPGITPSKPPSRVDLGILKLVRHRNSATLVPRIIDGVRSELGLAKVSYLYEPKDKSEPLRHYDPDGSVPSSAPAREVFAAALAELTGAGVRPVADLEARSGVLAGWAGELRKNGIDYVASFPVTNGRSGLLLLRGDVAPEAIARRVEELAPATMELVSNAESYERMQALSYTDNLTGVANQRYLMKRLQEEINRAERYRRSLALIMFDMDDLKGINDQFGHLAGDQVLRRLGQILRNSIRAIDVVARYGGDEFCVVMPEADEAVAVRFMSRLREKIVESRFRLPEGDQDVVCTISQGAAVFPEHAGDQNALINAADMALLTAKEAGRNGFLVYNSTMAAK